MEKRGKPLVKIYEKGKKELDIEYDNNFENLMKVFYDKMYPVGSQFLGQLPEILLIGLHGKKVLMGNQNQTHVISLFMEMKIIRLVIQTNGLFLC